jgi:hypothetical protein
MAGSARASVSKFLSGSIAPTGAVTQVRLLLQNVAGSIPLAGSLYKLVSRTVSGTMFASGAVVYSIGRLMAGVVTPVGRLTSSITQSLSGAVSSIVGSISSSIVGQITRDLVFTTFQIVRRLGSVFQVRGTKDTEFQIRTKVDDTFER